VEGRRDSTRALGWHSLSANISKDLPLPPLSYSK